MILSSVDISVGQNYQGDECGNQEWTYRTAEKLAF